MNRENNYIKYAFGINAVQLVLCLGVYLLRKYALWENEIVQIAALLLQASLWVLISMAMILSGSVTHKNTVFSYAALSVMPIILLTLISFGMSFVEAISSWTSFSFLGAAVMFWNKPAMLLCTLIPLENVYYIYIVNYLLLLLCAFVGAMLGRSTNIRLNRTEDTTVLLPREAEELAVGVSLAHENGDTIVMDKEALEHEISAETANIITQLEAGEDSAEESEAQQAEAAKVDTQKAAEERAAAEAQAAAEKAEAAKAEAEEAERAKAEAEAQKAAAEAAKAEAEEAERARSEAEKAKAEAEAARAEAEAQRAEAERARAEAEAAKAAAQRAKAEANRAEEEKKRQSEEVTVNPFDPKKAASAEGQNIVIYRDIRTGQEIKISVQKITEE